MTARFRLMRCAAAVVGAYALSLTGAGAQQASGLMGANTVDLALQFIGRSSGGDGSPGYQRVTRALGVKTILDARDAGFAFLRLSMTGYGPTWPNDPKHNDLALWQTNPTVYWSDIDAMFDALDKAQIRIVPSLLFNLIQFPAIAGDTVSDYLTNPKSPSRILATRYITEFVDRYKNRPTILFYEMGNEANLGENLDQVLRCNHETAASVAAVQCASKGNYSTQDLIGFSRDFVALLKRLDPSHQVSSGFGDPRPAAYHLEQRPEFSSRGADWTADSLTQFVAYVLALNAPFDIVSLHIYAHEGKRLPLDMAKDTDIATLMAKLFHPKGKKIFVGEFGDQGSSDLDGDIALLVKEKVVDYAAIWIWEYHPFNLLQGPGSHRNDYPVAPESPVRPLQQLRPALSPTLAPSPVPRVVLTWPLPCADLAQPLNLSAVASVGASLPQKIDFLVDGRSIGTVTAPPYFIPFDPRPLGRRNATLAAVAYGPGGVTQRFSSDVHLNGSTDACTIGP